MSFEELEASFAVHRTFGRLPKVDQACLEKALAALRDGRLAMDPARFLAERLFVTFACGYTIWFSVSRDGKKAAIEDLYKDPYGESP
jgi:hypothetical protein